MAFFALLLHLLYFFCEAFFTICLLWGLEKNWEICDLTQFLDRCLWTDLGLFLSISCSSLLTILILHHCLIVELHHLATRLTRHHRKSTSIWHHTWTSHGHLRMHLRHEHLLSHELLWWHTSWTHRPYASRHWHALHLLWSLLAFKLVILIVVHFLSLIINYNNCLQLICIILLQQWMALIKTSISKATIRNRPILVRSILVSLQPGNPLQEEQLNNLQTCFSKHFWRTWKMQTTKY